MLYRDKFIQLEMVPECKGVYKPQPVALFIEDLLYEQDPILKSFIFMYCVSRPYVDVGTYAIPKEGGFYYKLHLPAMNGCYYTPNHVGMASNSIRPVVGYRQYTCHESKLPPKELWYN